MVTYFKLLPKGIVNDIVKDTKIRDVNILGVKFLVFPGVYPSERFRTTNFLLKSIPNQKNKKICDMGCGIGVVGIHAILKGANKVAFVDINEFAVKNTIKNLEIHNISSHKSSVYHSNCFDNVPPEIFDLIVFNIPFHEDNIEIHIPLERAFYDPSFQSVNKFLQQARNYSNQSTKILIAFSSKGNTIMLEHLFNVYRYDWKLWKIKNKKSEYDNRLYLLTL